MSKTEVIIIIISIFLSSTTHAQIDPIEKSWIKEDSIFIDKVIKTAKYSPLKIEYLFKNTHNKSSNLGFGYISIEGSNGKGYVSIFFQFIYYKNNLISYSLSPQMPGDSRIRKRYKNIYTTFFSFDKNDEVMQYYYGYDFIATPLDDYPYKFIGYPQFCVKNELSYYMTPFSGTVYGKTGGEASQKLENRRVYDNIKHLLTPELYIYLLYSKNPATRLTAIEYIKSHPYIVQDTQNDFKKRSAILFKTLPTVWTMNGCFLIQDNAQKLVNFYSEHK